MGLIAGHYSFVGPTPSLQSIMEKITEISTLPVTILESESDDWHELRGSIAFTCMPEFPLELYAQRAGVATKLCGEMFDNDAQRAFMKQIVTGANEPAGQQTVHLRTYVGLELTLYFVASIALEQLGGRSTHAIPDDTWAEFGQPITEAELRARHRRWERKARYSLITTVLLLPLLAPLWLLLSLLWILCTTPYRIWRASKIMKQMEQGGSVS